jgi:hypothetical protein
MLKAFLQSIVNVPNGWIGEDRSFCIRKSQVRDSGYTDFNWLEVRALNKLK